MPAIGHLAVGLASARVKEPPGRISVVVWTIVLVAASYAPDLDVLGFALGTPYGAPLGHRGATHSLVCAAICGLFAGAVAWCFRARPLAVATWVGLVMASHGVLDTFTDGGKGIALLWPFTNHRYFAPWRPILVSPIGLRAIDGAGGAVILHETIVFLPLFLFAVWPRKERESGPTMD